MSGSELFSRQKVLAIGSQQQVAADYIGQWSGRVISESFEPYPNSLV